MASRNGAPTLRGGRKMQLVGVWEAHEIVGVERSRFARWLAPFRDSVRAVQAELGLAEKERDGRLTHELRERIADAGLKPKFAPPSAGLPMPADDLKSGPVWLRDDMEEFARAWGERREPTPAK